MRGKGGAKDGYEGSLICERGGRRGKRTVRQLAATLLGDGDEGVADEHELRVHLAMSASGKSLSLKEALYPSASPSRSSALPPLLFIPPLRSFTFRVGGGCTLVPVVVLLWKGRGDKGRTLKLRVSKSERSKPPPSDSRDAASGREGPVCGSFFCLSHPIRRHKTHVLQLLSRVDEMASSRHGASQI